MDMKCCSFGGTGEISGRVAEKAWRWAREGRFLGTAPYPLPQRLSLKDVQPDSSDL